MVITRSTPKYPSIKSVVKADRVVGAKYLDTNGRLSIWNGNELRCEHGRQRAQCKDCGGSQICEHGRVRSTCKDCGGSQVCDHGRQSPTCKDCGGSQVCEHGLQRSYCRACDGSQICKHKRVRSRCRKCQEVIGKEYAGYLLNEFRKEVFERAQIDQDSDQS